MTDPLRQILEEIQQDSGVPAVAGIVVSHAAIRSQAAIGVRRLGDNTPITIDDRFQHESHDRYGMYIVGLFGIARLADHASGYLP